MAKATKKENMNIFAKRLGELIKENRYTHEVVAKSIGVTRQGVGKWVSGESVPDILTVSKIAEFFTVSVDYLAGTTDIMSSDTGMRAACQYTGLSEATISLINATLTDKELTALSRILDNEDFLEVLFYLDLLSKERKENLLDHEISYYDLCRYRISQYLEKVIDVFDYRKMKEVSNYGKHTPPKE